MKCSNCGFINQDCNNFCISCGSRLNYQEKTRAKQNQNIALILSVISLTLSIFVFIPLIGQIVSIILGIISLILGIHTRKLGGYKSILTIIFGIMGICISVIYVIYLIYLYVVFNAFYETNNQFFPDGSYFIVLVNYLKIEF